MSGLMSAFVDFARLEKLAGGPDPHMALAVHHAQNLLRVQDRWWWGGVYVGVYNYPTAERIDMTWSLNDVLSNGQAELTAWLAANWPGIATRRERRSVRTPEQLARFMYTYAEWVDRTMDLLEAGVLWPAAGPQTNYEQLWADSQRSVYALGRYSCLKLMEYLRRIGAPIAQPDLRLIDGWSPLEGLAMMYPAAADVLARNDAEAAELGEALGADARSLAYGEGIELDNFAMQVLLCDFKQAVHNRQYPGRSQDSEIEYEVKIRDHWQAESPTMYAYRSELFPHWALGEQQNWDGVRKPLTTFYSQTGQMWSDSLYEWDAFASTGRVVPKVAAHA